MGKGPGVGKIAELTEIIRQVEEGSSQLNLPAPLTVNVKLVEHALCKFSKYCRFATQEKISDPFTLLLHQEIRRRSVRYVVKSVALARCSPVSSA